LQGRGYIPPFFNFQKQAMLINFHYKGMPAYAFAIHNFSQVNDAVLLVMADKKQQKYILLFTCRDVNWQTSEDLSLLNVESIHQINVAPSIFSNPIAIRGLIIRK